MNHHSHNADDPDNGSAPAALQTALAGLYRNRVAIPTEVDEAVLNAARGRLRTEPGTWRQAVRVLVGAGRRLRAWFQRPPLRWGAAAVLGVLALGLATLLLPPRTPKLAADFNRDGVVDILDALALARAVEAGTLRTAQFDLNGDGVVDRADADRVAALAVSLDSRRPL